MFRCEKWSQNSVSVTGLLVWLFPPWKESLGSRSSNALPNLWLLLVIIVRHTACSLITTSFPVISVWFALLSQLLGLSKYGQHMMVPSPPYRGHLSSEISSLLWVDGHSQYGRKELRYNVYLTLEPVVNSSRGQWEWRKAALGILSQNVKSDSLEPQTKHAQKLKWLIRCCALKLT